jgi:hypothetical protein
MEGFCVLLQGSLIIIILPLQQATYEKTNADATGHNDLFVQLRKNSRKNR